MQSSLFYKSGLILSSITDHYPVFLSIPGNTILESEKSTIIKFRLIDEFSIRKFKFALNSFLRTFEIPSNAKLAFEIFYNRFQELYNKYFPIKTKKNSRKSLLKPWVTPSLVKRIKIRDNLGRFAGNGRISKQTFTRFRNKVTKKNYNYLRLQNGFKITDMVKKS